MNKMDIVIKPVFMANDNKYDYAGEEEGAGLYKPVSLEFRFIVDTLRHVFGDDLDSCDMPIYCGSCFLRFEII